MRNVRCRFLSCCLLLAISGPAYALPAVPGAQTGQASPGAAQKQFQDKLKLPTLSPQIQVKEMNAQQAPKGAEKIHLKLLGINLEGMTVYKHDQLESIYQEKIGKNVTLAEVYGIAAEITRKYRNDGFILTQVIIPPQTIEGGQIKLRVVEGFVDKIEIQGSDSPAAIETIRSYATHVRTGHALNIKELERAMLLINDLPGLQAHGVLSPSKTPGAADLLVVLDKRKPYDAKIGIDNYGSKFLGPWEVTAAGSLNSALGHNELITLQVVDAPDSDLRSELFYAGLDYEQPIFGSGLRLELFTNNTHTNPGFTLKPFDVEGNSYVFGARLKYPFIRTRSLTDMGRVTFDINNVDSSNNVEPDRHDRIRSVRLGNRLEFIDTILSVGYNVFDVEASQGLDIWGARDESNINMSRANAEPDYFKAAGEAQHLQRITSDLNLLTAVSGQWSDSILYTSEEFGVGGTNFGRGYDPSEILGDSGIAGKIELQWNSPYKISTSFDIKNQFFTYYDIGRVWVNNPTSASLARASVASAGLGVRTTIDDVTSIGLMVGFPLTRPVATEGDNDPRVFFGLYRKF